MSCKNLTASMCRINKNCVYNFNEEPSQLPNTCTHTLAFNMDEGIVIGCRLITREASCIVKK